MFEKLGFKFKPVSSNRIIWVDLAKVIGLLAILTIHVSSSYLTDYPYTSGYWVLGLFFESFARFGIIIFVMISGFLLLRRKYDLKEFFSKRFKRVLLPFIFWNFIYILVKLKFQNPIPTNSGIFGVFSFIVNSFLDPRIVTIQFWFVYMIFALYIVTPILSSWIRNAKDKDIEYFLAIWIGLLIINFFKVKFLLGDYLTFFTGFVGYFVLGYYLVNKKSKYLNNFRIGLKLFLIGGGITFLGTLILSNITGQVCLLFIQLGDLTPFAVIQAIGVFIMVKNFPNKFFEAQPLLKKSIVKISLASFGVYLVNILVIRSLGLVGIYSTAINPIISIPIFTIITLAISTIIVLIMSKISFLKRFSGIP